MRSTWLGLALTLGLGVFAAPPAAADGCWIDTPSGYQRMGGAARIGPYADWYEASRVNNQYCQGNGSIRFKVHIKFSGKRVLLGFTREYRSARQLIREATDTANPLAARILALRSA